MKDDKKPVSKPPVVSDEEIAKRAPLPPWVLVSALQDTVHEAPTISRDAISVKVRIEKGKIVEDVRITASDKIVYHDDYHDD